MTGPYLNYQIYMTKSYDYNMKSLIIVIICKINDMASSIDMQTSTKRDNMNICMIYGTI